MEDRKNLIIQLRKEGKTYAEIGEMLKVSRQRVQQILFRKPPITKFCRTCNIKLGIGDGIIYCLDCTTSGKATFAKLEGRDRLREMVRVRDNQTCQICGKVWKKPYRKFDVHHLDGDKEGKEGRKYENHNIDRLITLCHKCHLNLHSVKEKMAKNKPKTKLSTDVLTKVLTHK